LLLPAPRGTRALSIGVPDQESPEWLTPPAIFAAFNPNKVLRK
jgi:hypothetical protein